jgi:uncharacterized protein YciI
MAIASTARRYAGHDHGMYFLLLYDYVDDYMERRGALRGEHLGLTEAAHEQGDLVMAGAVADPPDTGVLVWRVEDPATIEAFVAADPYVREGLVKGWRIRPWTVVLGGEP